MRVSAIAGLAVLRFAGGAVEPAAREDVSVFRIDLPRFAEGYRVASWQVGGPFADGETLLVVGERERVDRFLTENE